MPPPRNGFFPGDELVEEYEFPLDRRQLEAANRPTSRDRHRIAAWLGVEEVPLAAKLRHELEHARQWDACGERFVWFDCRMRDATAKAFGAGRGGGRVYNLFPTEVSANAAAADFVRRAYGEDAAAARRNDPHDALLFRNEGGTVPLDLLPRQTLCFASLTAREFDEEVGTDGLDECLAIAGELDRSLWRALCNDDEIQAAAREARRAIPTDEEIQSSELPGDAWETTAEQLRTGFGRALVLAGTPAR